MSIFSGIGKAIKKGVGFVGDVAKKAAPFAGLIPGVGTLAGAGLGALGSAGSDFGHSRKFDLGGALKSGALGGLSGFAGSKLLGGKGFMNIGNAIKGAQAMTPGAGEMAVGPAPNFLAGLGKALAGPGMFGNADGKGLNISKIIGAGGALMNVGGGIAQRKANQQALQSQTDLRNQLMSRILSGGGQTYNFQPES